jgi:hypothetical protein
MGYLQGSALIFSLNLFEKYQPGYKDEILASLCFSALELVEKRL